MNCTVRPIASPTAARRKKKQCALDGRSQLGGGRWPSGWRLPRFARRAASAQNMPLAERIKLCGACHGEDGNSRMPNIPSLAGQPEFFLTNQLFLFREGVRKIAGMSEVLKGLKDDDLVALAQHFTALAAKGERGDDRSGAGRSAAPRSSSRCAARPAICRASPARTRCRGWRSSGSTT